MPLIDTFIRTYLEDSAKVKAATAAECHGEAMRAAEAMANALKGGGKVMFCGNGGSAGDAQHIAAEFVATLDHRRPRPALAAMALTTDTSLITAYSNDFGFGGIFARQVEALGAGGDVLVGISTSGASQNVLAAFEAAAGRRITTIALTGMGGGRMAGLADICITVPSEQTAHIQESHIALGHAMVAAVEILLGYRDAAS